jgi:hypothetical protein
MPKKLFNRHKFRPYVLAPLGLALLLTVACDGKAKKQPVKPPPPDVQVTEVTQGKVNDRILLLTAGDLKNALSSRFIQSIFNFQLTRANFPVYSGWGNHNRKESIMIRAFNYATILVVLGVF